MKTTAKIIVGDSLIMDDNGSYIEWQVLDSEDTLLESGKIYNHELITPEDVTASTGITIGISQYG
jgi:hypothetical protein